MDLNFNELQKEWEESFYEGRWEPDTLEYTETEKKILYELKQFLPRHMDIYDWNLPYAEEILLIFRRHLIKQQKFKMSIIKKKFFIFMNIIYKYWRNRNG